jgi:O-antigen/teichoic acid export membrane protein
MQPVSKFFSDIMKSVSSSGVQLLITVITTPLMTRLYEPAAYGAFGVIHTMATTIIGVGLLSLPNAYPVEKDPAKRAALVHAMLLLLGLLVVLTSCAAIWMAAADTFEIEQTALILLPILVLTFGIRQIIVSVAIEGAKFGSLAVGQVIEPIFSRGGSIGLGAVFGGHPVFILVSVAVGHLVTSVAVARMIITHSLQQWRALFAHGARIKETLKDHADFIFYSTPSIQAQPLVMLGIQMMILAAFSQDVAGYYILAVSILILPSSVVSLATAPVVYREFIEIARTAPATLGRYTLRATLLYLVLGAVALSPVFFFGETLFRIIFGEVWGPAGKAAALLSIAYVGSFALVGVQSIFRVVNRMKLQFVLEIVTGLLVLLVVYLSFHAVPFETGILYLSIIWSVRNVILLVAGIMVANTHAGAA